MSPDDSFYHRIYDAMYQHGYKSEPDETTARDLCAYCVRHLDFESALDVGCGNGAAVALLSEAGKQAKGVDVSPTAAAMAREFGRDCVEGSILEIPVPDDSFDLLMSTDVFEHLRPEDVDRAISECFRVARKYLALRIATKPSNIKQSWIDAGITEVDNPHLTVQPIRWWLSKFKAHATCRAIYFDKRKQFILKLGEAPGMFDRLRGR